MENIKNRIPPTIIGLNLMIKPEDKVPIPAIKRTKGTIFVCNHMEINTTKMNETPSTIHRFLNTPSKWVSNFLFISTLYP